MAKMSEKALLARDAKRDVAAEIERGMRDVRAGRAARWSRKVALGGDAGAPG